MTPAAMEQRLKIVSKLYTIAHVLQSVGLIHLHKSDKDLAFEALAADPTKRMFDLTGNSPL